MMKGKVDLSGYSSGVDGMERGQTREWGAFVFFGHVRGYEEAGDGDKKKLVFFGVKGL